MHTIRIIDWTTSLGIFQIHEYSQHVVHLSNDQPFSCKIIINSIHLFEYQITYYVIPANEISE